MWLSPRAVSLLLLVGASALSTQVAADDKVFMGTVCRPSPMNPAASVYNFTTDAAITHSHLTEALFVTCPIGRDNTTSGTAINSARIDAFGNGGNMFCTFHSQDNDSTSRFSYERTSQFAIGYTSLIFPEAVSGGSGWSMFFNCTIPQRNTTHGQMFVKSFRVSEP